MVGTLTAGARRAALAAAGFPKVVAVGGYDPAVHPIAAKYSASGHLRALQAERAALARRINACLVTFTRSLHAPMADEPGAFNALLRDTWRSTRTSADDHVQASPAGQRGPGLIMHLLVRTRRRITR